MLCQLGPASLELNRMKRSFFPLSLFKWYVKSQVIYTGFSSHPLFHSAYCVFWEKKSLIFIEQGSTGLPDGWFTGTRPSHHGLSGITQNRVREANCIMCFFKSSIWPSPFGTQEAGIWHFCFLVLFQESSPQGSRWLESGRFGLGGEVCREWGRRFLLS